MRSLFSAPIASIAITGLALSCSGTPSPIDATDAEVGLDSSRTMQTGVDTGTDSFVTTSLDAGSRTDSLSSRDAADSPTSAETSTPSDGTSAVNLSAGCSSAKALKTGEFTLTTSDGVHATARSYVVQVPASADHQTPLALTLVYHGAGGNADSAKEFGLQNAQGAAASSIFVFPVGIEFQSYGIGWDDSCNGYDMKFFDQILANIEDTYCIDKSRVYVGGFSWGCDYVTALSCCRGDVIRAVAAGSCSDEFRDATNFKTYANLPCSAKKYPAVRFTHDSGPNGDGPYSAAQFASTSALFRSFQGCADPTIAPPTTGCVSYAPCASPVVECFYEGLGHSLPGDWATGSWNFFSSAP